MTASTTVSVSWATAADFAIRGLDYHVCSMVPDHVVSFIPKILDPVAFSQFFCFFKHSTNTVGFPPHIVTPKQAMYIILG